MTIRADQLAIQVWADDGGPPSDPVARGALEQQRGFALRILGKAGEGATRLARRYPLQSFAGALLLGFVLGRLRR